MSKEHNTRTFEGSSEERADRNTFFRTDSFCHKQHVRLFLREHVPLILYSYILMLLLLLVFWFDGYDHVLTALYAIFLGTFLLLMYLTYRYVSHRSFYLRLSQPHEVMHEFMSEDNHSPLPEALEILLEAQYRGYQEQIKSWERQHQGHITFMNQWVHQMKTPLSVIELITQREDDERFESIAEETDKLRKGLDMALYIARLETFEQDFSVDHVHLLPIVNKVVHDNKGFFIRNYVYPDVKIESILTVETDAKWLVFMLDQLLSNAIKYSAGTHEKVTISAYTQGEAVVLEVEDRGVGIPTADLPRVFRSFFTGENGREFKESTGMGLYLVKEVAEKLNHSVEIQSEAGKGTIVQIIFPYASRRTLNRYG
ncbi:sensor histidine kinase [Brevibacillus laterosporus]|nr:sensor histidine kinase [Brevibacillus laterosporus]MBM7107347.1 Sensor histidine kinase GraS [Brevibacillus laterosporus]